MVARQRKDPVLALVVQAQVAEVTKKVYASREDRIQIPR